MLVFPLGERGCGHNPAQPNPLSRAWKMRVTAPQHDADRTERLGRIGETVSAPGRRLFPDLGVRVMRISSSLVAPAAVAILATSLLCGLSGTAASQTTPSSPLPSVTVTAPEQRVRPPQRQERAAGAGTARRRGLATRTTGQTAGGTPQGPVMAKLARLEREASSCNDGCESSFRRGKDPWVGCSESAGYYSVFSATCKDTLTHRDYGQCVETKMFLGWERNRPWWYCTGMLAGGKFRVTAENRNR